MPPFDTDDLTGAVRRLEEADPGDRAELAIRIQRMLLEKPNVWGNFPAALAERYRSMIEADRPAVRSIGALAAGHFAYSGEDFYDDVEAVDETEAAAAVFDALDDESPLVRQVAAGCGVDHLGDVVSRVLDDPEYRPLPAGEIATTLFRRLHDDDPTVRLRIGATVLHYGDELFRAHPEARAAVRTLVGVFDDDLNANCVYDRPTAAPRRAAFRVLELTFGEYDESPVVAHVDEIAARLSDEHRQVGRSAGRLLERLRAAGHITVKDIADEVITAATRLDADRWWSGFPELALRTALARDDAVEPVYEHLRARYTAANKEMREWSGGDAYLIAFSRLVRAADHPFDPHAETLAATIARDTAATDGTDPLVLLAPDFPEFVAEQLRRGYGRVVEDDLGRRRRFCADLVVDVADRNPTAVEGVPDVLAENFADRRVRDTIAALVDAHPELAVHAVPEGFARSECEAPLSTDRLELIEETAAHWERAPDGLVETLVDTAGYSYTDRWAPNRRGAVRALVALHEGGLSVLPESFGPFVDRYEQGAFDEDDDPVDPLEMDAAESAGLR